MPYTIFESPFGPLTLIAGADGLRRLYFPRQAPALDESERDPQRLAAAVEQLDQYFRGERNTFELALEWHGTPFQRRVWRALQATAYGTTTTYGALAKQLASGPGNGAHEARAVGAAVASTPIPIVIPCHRVIGADGSLTGYGGGLNRKRALLDFEAAGGARGALDAAWRQRQLALL
ncbi:MAG TPA: methylated-DNA--[protein]-cysteine S-methyltransferase [Solirubrobacteraceae bacterium]